MCPNFPLRAFKRMREAISCAHDRRLTPAAREAVISVCCLLGLASRWQPRKQDGSAVTNHGPGTSYGSDLAVDADGNGLAVWVDTVGVVQVARYSNSSGAWTPAVALSSSTERVYEPRIAVNAAGDSVAVWAGHDAVLGPL